MKKCTNSEILITGIGITSSIGQGKENFTSALFEGKHNFSIMKREGRQNNTSFIGAEISELFNVDKISKKLLRTISFSSKVSLVTLEEAWNDAQLDKVDPSRIGLVVGGSNFNQREIVNNIDRYKDKLKYLNPMYSLYFMDNDTCGVCTQQFGIKGPSFSIGAASASGQVAILQALNMIKSNEVDVAIVIGALADLSYMECQGFRNIGAMGSDGYKDNPELACRPFDKNRDGFIFGESCGVIVLERSSSISRDNVKPYAKVRGCSMIMDSVRNPNPSLEGEVAVIKKVLKESNIKPDEIQYINTHGTGSVIGDETEVKAIKECNLTSAYVNATKSIIGHGLTSAGTVEVIATLLQIQSSTLHPIRNLESEIDSDLNWVKGKSISSEVNYALSFSFGFGGINTAICLEKY